MLQYMDLRNLNIFHQFHVPSNPAKTGPTFLFFSNDYDLLMIIYDDLKA